MFTTGSKYWLGLAGVLLVAALGYGLSTGGDPVGVISVGYKGGVGDHLGYGILIFGSVVALVAGALTLAWRDADPEAQALSAGTEEVPEADAPDSPSWWPVVTAFAFAIGVVGIVVEPFLVALAIGLLAVVIVEWTVKVWADRRTGDPDVNRSIRNRLMFPVEIPGIAIVIIAFVVLGLSRVLLALPRLGSTAAAVVMASVIMLTASLVAWRPRMNATLVTIVLLIGGLAVVAGGVVGAVVGEREFHPHEEEHEEPEVGPEQPGGLPATTTIATTTTTASGDGTTTTTTTTP